MTGSRSSPGPQVALRVIVFRRFGSSITSILKVSSVVGSGLLPIAYRRQTKCNRGHVIGVIIGVKSALDSFLFFG